MYRFAGLRVALALALGLVMADADAAQADGSPVVVELFTSQGCSSCPPADALLGQLATRDDVIALALHVDYWDYLGWKDAFANPEFTARQRQYARAAGKNTIYTPQMIIGGQDHVVGYRPKEVANLIQRHSARPAAMDLSVAVKESGGLRIRAEGAVYGDMVVQLVTYAPMRSVDIARGENAGRRIAYANIVTGWHVLGAWDGNAPLILETRPRRGEDRAVVIVQKAGAGPIVAAARVE